MASLPRNPSFCLLASPARQSRGEGGRTVACIRMLGLSIECSGGEGPSGVGKGRERKRKEIGKQSSNCKDRNDATIRNY